MSEDEHITCPDCGTVLNVGDGHHDYEPGNTCDTCDDEYCESCIDSHESECESA